MLVLARSLCLHATLLAGSGAILGSAAFAQTRHEIPVQNLLVSPKPAAERVAPSLTGNAPAPVKGPQSLNSEALGDLYIVRHRYQAAIAAYSKAPQTTAAVWDKIGVAYQMLFDDRDAIHCYQQALKLAPAMPMR